MKKIALAFAICSYFGVSAQNNFNVQNGTLVDVIVVNQVSSENENPASIQVAHDVMDNNGKVIIKQGAPVKFNIERTKRSGVGKPGNIEVEFLGVNAADGQLVKLNGKYSKEGKSLKGKVLGVSLGVGLGTFLFPMLAYMAKKGEAAIITQNTVVSNLPVLGSYTVK